MIYKIYKLIKFDKKFNDDISGLIKVKVKTLIFGIMFKKIYITFQIL